MSLVVGVTSCRTYIYILGREAVTVRYFLVNGNSFSHEMLRTWRHFETAV